MATSNRPRTSSFSRNLAGPTSQVPGLKPGPSGSLFVSSGIPDLDRILGGGFCLGSLVMVMEDSEAPHHMLLLRNFMAQGLFHNQTLIYASPSKDPRGLLGTLPSLLSSSINDDKHGDHPTYQDKNLRIAWQYKKYFGDDQLDTEIRGTAVLHPALVASLSSHFVLPSVDILTRTGTCLLLSSFEGHDEDKESAKATYWISGNGWSPQHTQSGQDQHSGAAEKLD